MRADADVSAPLAPGQARDEGFRGLYAGLGVRSAHALSQAFVYFFAYNLMRRRWEARADTFSPRRRDVSLARPGPYMHPSPLFGPAFPPVAFQAHTKRKLSVGTGLLIGLLAGWCNTALTEPLDTIATFRQARRLGPSTHLKSVVFRPSCHACPTQSPQNCRLVLGARSCRRGERRQPRVGGPKAPLRQGSPRPARTAPRPPPRTRTRSPLRAPARRRAARAARTAQPPAAGTSPLRKRRRHQRRRQPAGVAEEAGAGAGPTRRTCTTLCASRCCWRSRRPSRRVPRIRPCRRALFQGDCTAVRL